MTQEDKELLLIDLSARLPYKPIVHAKWSYTEPDGSRKYNEADRELIVNDFYDIWHVKPYLRPMSSMTEDEHIEYYSHVVLLNSIEKYDWLNAHHFDYRGLIEKGLALEAPKDMY